MSVFDMLREKDEQQAHEDSREALAQKVAEKFNPQKDITTLELALIFKLFAIATVDMNLNTIKKKWKRIIWAVISNLSSDALRTKEP